MNNVNNGIVSFFHSFIVPYKGPRYIDCAAVPSVQFRRNPMPAMRLRRAQSIPPAQVEAGKMAESLGQEGDARNNHGSRLHTFAFSLCHHVHQVCVLSVW